MSGISVRFGNKLFPSVVYAIWIVVSSWRLPACSVWYIILFYHELTTTRKYNIPCLSGNGVVLISDIDEQEIFVISHCLLLVSRSSTSPCMNIGEVTPLWACCLQNLQLNVMPLPNICNLGLWIQCSGRLSIIFVWSFYQFSIGKNVTISLLPMIYKYQGMYCGPKNVLPFLAQARCAHRTIHTWLQVLINIRMTNKRKKEEQIYFHLIFCKGWYIHIC